MLFEYINSSTFPSSEQESPKEVPKKIALDKEEKFTLEFVSKMDDAMRDMVLEDNIEYTDSNISLFSTSNDTTMYKNSNFNF